MYQQKNLVLAAIFLGLMLAWVGFAAATRAAVPTPQGTPTITDRFPHLWGVLVVPRAEVQPEGPAQAAAPASSGCFGRLVPPIFGANVNATLANASAQNETTIAINPEDD